MKLAMKKKRQIRRINALPTVTSKHIFFQLTCKEEIRWIQQNKTKQNSHAWDKKVEEGSRYTQSVSRDVIEKSKAGDWKITVTTEKSVPRNWFPDSVAGLKILCLASGGGQQAPVLAAAGADVTVMATRAIKMNVECVESV